MKFQAHPHHYIKCGIVALLGVHIAASSRLAWPEIYDGKKSIAPPSIDAVDIASTMLEASCRDAIKIIMLRASSMSALPDSCGAAYQAIAEPPG